MVWGGSDSSQVGTGKETDGTEVDVYVSGRGKSLGGLFHEAEPCEPKAGLGMYLGTPKEGITQIWLEA